MSPGRSLKSVRQETDLIPSNSTPIFFTIQQSVSSSAFTLMASLVLDPSLKISNSSPTTQSDKGTAITHQFLHQSMLSFCNQHGCCFSLIKISINSLFCLCCCPYWTRGVMTGPEYSINSWLLFFFPVPGGLYVSWSRFSCFMYLNLSEFPLSEYQTFSFGLLLEQKLFIFDLLPLLHMVIWIQIFGYPLLLSYYQSQVIPFALIKQLVLYATGKRIMTGKRITWSVQNAVSTFVYIFPISVPAAMKLWWEMQDRYRNIFINRFDLPLLLVNSSNGNTEKYG